MAAGAGYTLKEIAARVGGSLFGDGTQIIRGVTSLTSGAPDAITFLSSGRYSGDLRQTTAAAVLLREEHRLHSPVATVVVADPYLAYARVSQLFAFAEPTAFGAGDAVIDASAQVAPSARIAPNVVIGPRVVVEAGVVMGAGCVIGADSHIGEEARLYPNVTLYHGVTIGKRARIHSGAVIGSDGFGFANDHGVWVKIEQLGGVVLGDDVEVGANTTIDRGAITDTVIEDGVKLDNQIQVAHNVRIGAHTAIAGCVGIAGSAHIGAYCAIGGGVGILGHLTICDRVTVTAMSLVTSSITAPGIYSSGVPLEPKRQAQKNSVRFRQLDALARRVQLLEKQLARS
ncbi:MAG: UDP-3-O-(3-hydroxymyristoyl)glucosamine N-acyltransferase [Gammaproteobacteria bacterium]|nr:UDP-3-O-(3-hydroxymyristoyl)glucosamine N-acyltransferase [Gammaproteobacteria bacterium]